MGCGKLKVACDDGFEIVTKNHEELVALTNWHLQHSHGKEESREAILKMAKHP